MRKWTAAIFLPAEIDRSRRPCASRVNLADLQLARPLGADGAELTASLRRTGRTAPAPSGRAGSRAPRRPRIACRPSCPANEPVRTISSPCDRGGQLHPPRRIAEGPLQRGEVGGGAEGLPHRAARAAVVASSTREAGPVGTQGQDMGRRRPRPRPRGRSASRPRRAAGGSQAEAAGQQGQRQWQRILCVLFMQLCT